MITLTITKQDGSPYWVTYFNYQSEAAHWLEVERTRTDWSKAYVATTSGVDFVPMLTDPKILADAQAKRDGAITYLSSFQKEKFDIGDIGEIINAMLVLQGIK